MLMMDNDKAREMCGQLYQAKQVVKGIKMCLFSVLNGD